jgi:hypothetical protein
VLLNCCASSGGIPLKCSSIMSFGRRTTLEDVRPVVGAAALFTATAFATRGSAASKMGVAARIAQSARNVGRIWYD